MITVKLKNIIFENFKYCLGIKSRDKKNDELPKILVTPKWFGKKIEVSNWFSYIIYYHVKDFDEKFVQLIFSINSKKGLIIFSNI